MRYKDDWRRRLQGRLKDCDGHLYLMPDVMADILGAVDGGWVEQLLVDQAHSPDFEAERQRARREPWLVKGLAALGAFDPADRVSALDAMGIERQLLFSNTMGRELRIGGADSMAAIRHYNDYAIEFTRAASGRARAVCQLNLTDIDAALAEAARVVDAGAAGVHLCCAAPPGGTSPANAAWDPLWSLLSSANVPAFLHLGSSGLMSGDDDDPMFVPRAWADAPSLRARFTDQPGAEERLGPFFFINAQMGAEVFVGAMVMGGVFEHFPDLRFGIIEFGADWVGPWCERMDKHANLLAKLGRGTPLLPSDYVERNVRVTPFAHDPVDTFIDRYGLSSVYVFSTDFPHIEGGKDPVGSFLQHTGRLDDDTIERFFVENAELLFP